MTNSDAARTPLSRPDTSQLRAFGETPGQMRGQLDAAFERFEADLRKVQGHWLSAPAEGRWSPAQVTEHVLIVNEGIAKIIRLLLSDKPLRPLERTPGVQQGGKREAPASLRPGQGQPWEALQERWQASRERLSELSSHLEGADLSRRMFHPFYDDLDAHNWMRMAIAHTRQHRRQLAE
ncbi:DinB family protein [Deinococcus sp.]|uniref:DinB family protein n=1 Tax=Deinococcus sp. TaxID=47478 RepID=UPI003CC55010